MRLSLIVLTVLASCTRAPKQDSAVLVPIATASALRAVPSAAPLATDSGEAATPAPPSVRVLAFPVHAVETASLHALAIDATHVTVNDSFGRVFRAPKDGSAAPVALVPGRTPMLPNPAPLPGGVRVHVLGVFDDRGDILMTSQHNLLRVPKLGGPVSVVDTEQEDPVSLAADASDVFFSMFDGSPIRRLRRAGGASAAFHPGIKSGDLALDATHLWVADYARGTLDKTPRAGGAPTLVLGGLAKPTALALDATHAYVGCEGDGTVRRVAKAGGPGQVLARGQQNHDALAVDDGHVYWVSQAQDRPLVRVKKDGSGRPETLMTGMTTPAALAVDDAFVWVVDGPRVLGVPKDGKLHERPPSPDERQGPL